MPRTRSLSPLLVALALVVLLAGSPSPALAGSVADAPNGICPAPLGTKLPDLALRRMDGSEIAMHALLEGNASVLLIYRGGWCPYCNAHLNEIATIEEDLHDLGYQLLAVSPDAPPQLSATEDQNHLGYTLLSDSGMELAKALGIAYRLDEATVEKYRGYGIDLEQASGRDHHLLPVPAALIVDAMGVIRFFYVDPDYKSRIDARILLAAAEVFKPGD